MYVATIIPIARGIPFDTLSYYCLEMLNPGTLVSIPFGKQNLTGIVLETNSLLESKTAIKNAPFSLKKIKKVLGTFSYFEKIALAITSTSSQTLTPIGALAGNVIPQFIFEYINSEKVSELSNSNILDQKLFNEQISLGPTKDREDYYKRLIRSSFANKKSVLFVAPTIRSLEFWQKKLEKGVQKYVVIIHSKTTKKNLRTFFSLIKSSERPLLIFVTPGFCSLPRNDLGTIVVEDESSNLYKTNDRYGTDLRVFLKEFAQQFYLTIFWGDLLPRFETISRLESTNLPRTYIPDKLNIIPIEHYRTTLPSEVIELLRYAQIKKRKLFIYTHRKGLAPISRCSDCSTTVSCPSCSLPMVLKNKLKQNGNKERYFICTYCGENIFADHNCTYCGSWNITPLYIGTESLYNEICSLVGSDSVFTLNEDVTPDSVAVENLLTEFNQKKFAVIIGTTKILSYLKNVDYTIVPFFDRILSTPSIYTIEQTLHMIMQSNEKSDLGVLLCTKNSEFPLIKKLEMRKINMIIEEELETRKELGYPPFGLLIKISITVPDGYRQKIKSLVEDYLKEVDFTPTNPRRISLGSMKVLMVWIIKSPTNYIENEGQQLLSFLESLRFPYKIEQNPERF